MDNWPAGLSTGCFRQESILTCLETIEDDGLGLGAPRTNHGWDLCDL